MVSRNGRLVGHRLPNGGRIEAEHGIGEAVCECGAASSSLGSVRRRRQWHRDHKDAVRAARAAARRDWIETEAQSFRLLIDEMVVEIATLGQEEARERLLRDLAARPARKLARLLTAGVEVIAMRRRGRQ